jgi:hypothetical protein
VFLLLIIAWSLIYVDLSRGDEKNSTATGKQRAPKPKWNISKNIVGNKMLDQS